MSNDHDAPTVEQLKERLIDLTGAAAWEVWLPCLDALIAASIRRAGQQEDVRLQAASQFIRDIIDALGHPQPPLDAHVNLGEIAFQAVSQIEEYKVRAEAAEAQLRKYQTIVPCSQHPNADHEWVCCHVDHYPAIQQPAGATSWPGDDQIGPGSGYDDPPPEPPTGATIGPPRRGGRCEGGMHVIPKGMSYCECGRGWILTLPPVPAPSESP